MVEKKEGEKRQRRSLTKLELRMHMRANTHTNTHTYITSPTNTHFVRVNIINRACFQSLAHKSRNTWNVGIGGGGWPYISKLCSRMETQTVDANLSLKLRAFNVWKTKFVLTCYYNYIFLLY